MDETSDSRRAIQTLADLLEEDRARPAVERRYPDQALPALHDERVLRALQQRLDKGMAVGAVITFGHNPFTKLAHTLFVMTDPEVAENPRGGVLVITDSKCRVVGVVDDFVFPASGSTIRLPITRPAGTQPFVLQQPSAAEQTLHVGDPVSRRSHVGGVGGTPAGFTPLPDGGGPVWPWGVGGGLPKWPGGGRLPGWGSGRIPGGHGGVVGEDTTCTYDTSTSTLIGYSCKQITGLLVEVCDGWGNDYDVDYQADTEVDDSGKSGLFGTGLAFPW